MGAVEFDKHASQYDGGMGHPLKRLAGFDREQFIEIKSLWQMASLESYAQTKGVDLSEISLLDYGCGDGVFLRHLRQLGFAGTLSAYDPSVEMCAVAAQRWLEESPPRWLNTAPQEPDAFDFVILSAVLHHVEPLRRSALIRNIVTVLKPGGYMVVFEHNPWNPLTQLVVRTSSIDENAVLMSSNELRQQISRAGLKCERLEYLMFFPPRFTFLRRLERRFRRIPLGAQFALSAKKEIEQE